MTLSPIRQRPLAAFAALALASGLALPAQAQSGAFYVAELAQPRADSASFAAGGIAWRCEGTRCTAPRSRARPLRICRELQRKAGEVRAFSADGEALAEDRLARCNG